MILKSLSKHENTGLLLIRLALGAFFLTRGYPILFGGASAWKHAGDFATGLGLDSDLAFLILGCALGLFEFIGGAGLLLGFLTVPSVLLVMTALGVTIIAKWDGFSEAGILIALEVILLGLVLIGPGRYALDEKIEWKG